MEESLRTCPAPRTVLEAQAVLQKCSLVGDCTKHLPRSLPPDMAAGFPFLYHTTVGQSRLSNICKFVSLCPAFYLVPSACVLEVRKATKVLYLLKCYLNLSNMKYKVVIQ